MIRSGTLRLVGSPAAPAPAWSEATRQHLRERGMCGLAEAADVGGEFLQSWLRAFGLSDGDVQAARALPRLPGFEELDALIASEQAADAEGSIDELNEELEEFNNKPKPPKAKGRIAPRLPGDEE